MDTEKIKKELRFLKVYSLIATMLFAVLFFIAAKQAAQRTKFQEIDVERVNIVERDGKLRLAIANRDRSPGPIIGGMYMKTREGQRPGMIFFNDKGDECGGMTWGSKEEDGNIRANAGLMFDQYNQDQTVGITYSQNNEVRSAGLMVWDRPLTPLAEFAKRLGEIESMEGGSEKTAAMKKLRAQAVESGLSGVTRIFVGRGSKSEAVVSLADTKGKPRILMSVDGEDVPSIQFLDENGKVVYKLPADTPGQ
ncbi:MAG: hypothetical protein JXB23_12030 [Candidatus Aminicenantes bacterium]|nr:hypothetical protein [Candidatus Aminicenantes bacterium]